MILQFELLPEHWCWLVHSTSIMESWKNVIVSPTLYPPLLLFCESKSLWKKGTKVIYRRNTYDQETEADAQRCSVKKVFLEILQNSQENTCVRVSFWIKLQASVCNFIKKETLTQVFSFEFGKISENTFSYRTPPVTASEKRLSLWFLKTHKTFFHKRTASGKIFFQNNLEHLLLSSLK